MRKFGVFTATIFITVTIAGLYGIVHDQVTYSISAEYFTKFKYPQFGFEPAWFGGHRQTVAVIGFLATWWMGLFIGIVLAATGLIFPGHRSMRAAVANATGIVFITAMVFAFFGSVWGRYRLVNTGVDWWLPEDLIDKNDFITVGSIHNFSYLGGIAGLVIAIAYMIRKYLQLAKHSM